MPQLYSYFEPTTPEIVLRSLFSKYDKDNNGTLDVHELHKLLVDDLGLYEEHVEMYMMLLDKNANGCIDRSEFMDWLRSGEKLRNAETESRFDLIQRAVEMFKYYDADGSGAIDRREFDILHTDMGGRPEGLVAAMGKIDIDGNGKISFYEFMKWLNWVDMEKL